MVGGHAGVAQGGGCRRHSVRTITTYRAQSAQARWVAIPRNRSVLTRWTKIAMSLGSWLTRSDDSCVCALPYSARVAANAPIPRSVTHAGPRVMIFGYAACTTRCAGGVAIAALCACVVVIVTILPRPAIAVIIDVAPVVVLARHDHNLL